VRQFHAGDEAGMFEVVSAAFQPWPKIEIPVPPVDHLHWKITGPGTAPGYHRVVQDGGRYIGTQLYIARPGRLNGHGYLIGQGVDFAVHPDYQGRGVRSAMRQAARDFLPRHSDAHLSMRSRHPAMVRVAARYGDNAMGFANETQILVHSRGGEPRGAADGVTLRTVETFDHRFDTLFEDAGQPFRFIMERTADVLNWRYADPRAGCFTITIAEQGRHLLGYCVAARSHQRGTIADLLALPERNDVVDSLVSHAVQSLSTGGASAIECWVQRQHPYRRVLARHGFVGRRRRIWLGLRPYGAPIEEFDFMPDPAAPIHITAGDTDLV
jgi:GNAT superfamily N-acetyltransferase